ncbi:ribonuclease H-like domain-containing protein [Mycena floridula]|nr:ribonuclease H-like domain-containing protein [Mycena floridula]
MLIAWMKFVRDSDPDLITGFNQIRYDIPYISRRAQLLNIPCVLGRIKGLLTLDPSTVLMTDNTKRLHADRPPIPSRIQLDLLHHVKLYEGTYKKLDDVAKAWLGDTKVDIGYEAIPHLQSGTDDDRRSLALYCLKDSYLP